MKLSLKFIGGNVNGQTIEIDTKHVVNNQFMVYTEKGGKRACIYRVIESGHPLVVNLAAYVGDNVTTPLNKS